MERDRSSAKRKRDNPVKEFVKKWIFHILVIVLGICALFTKAEYDWYVAALIFVVTLLWIIRNIFSRTDE